VKPPADIAAAVRAELAVPGRYDIHEAVRPAHEPWWLTAWRWIWDRLADLAHAIGQRVPNASGFERVAGVLLVLAALALVAYVLARLIVALDVRTRRPQSVPLGSAPNAHALMQAAMQAAAAREYTRAVRIAFIAAVTLLDLRGVVRDDASATVNELRSALAARGPAVGEPFLRLARLYTAAAYAETPADDADWGAARGAYDALVKALA
jgi:hypothetical protein